MFFRLLMESFRRQRRRKLLAGIAILLGTTAVTAMLALATTIGDRIHRELAVYGANIIVYPKADQLEVKVGGVDIKPASSGTYLKESDLEKLKTIFWANNITGISPELDVRVIISPDFQETGSGGNQFMYAPTTAVGYWFNHPFNSIRTGAPVLHPWWKLAGQWPSPTDPTKGSDQSVEVVAGAGIARQLRLHLGDRLAQVIKTQNPSADMHFKVSGIVTTGDATDDELLLSLADAQSLAYGGNGVLNPHGISDAISRVEISARTKPEDAFARKDPDTLSPKDHEIWYCRPYANSIAYQIREAIPGAQAEQVRRVEQSEGNILKRISGLMWLISAAALLAAGFAVSAAMATAILERRGEIGLMRSLGASKGAIALLFYAETGLLAIFAGTLGYLAGSGLAAWLGARIFRGDGGAPEAILIPVLLPVVVALALAVAIGGSTPSIRAALRMNPSAILREDG
jgi:putative ABC transport system permease protein